jgi:hypothetical protein
MRMQKIAPMVKSDIYFYGNDFHFEQQEVFAVQALIAPNQQYIYSKEIGTNDLNYFNGDNKQRLVYSKSKSTDTCFWVTLRDTLTTKLNNNGIRPDLFEISTEGMIYGEIKLNIQCVRFKEVY